jgi:hypothetical protein
LTKVIAKNHLVCVGDGIPASARRYGHPMTTVLYLLPTAVFVFAFAFFLLLTWNLLSAVPAQRAE